MVLPLISLSIVVNLIFSRNTIMAGREDFTFNLAGGAGNDDILVAFGTTGVALVLPPAIQPGVLPPAAVSPAVASTLTGGFQNWYTNQKLNANLRIDGGDGNDTIRKPGAGDAIIFGGSGTDTIYVDNSGRQTVTVGSDNDAGRAYAAAAAAELAAGVAANLAANATDVVLLTGYTTALNTLNLATPVSFTDPAVPANPNPVLPTKANLETAINAVFTSGAITVDQQLALYNAYATRAIGSTITPSTTVVGASTISAAGAPVNAALTAAEFAAGNALLDSYITTAAAARNAAVAADAAALTYVGLLNATQAAVATSNVAVNGVFDGAASVPGTSVILAGLNALNSALILGATQDAWVAALKASVVNGSRTLVQAQAIETAIGAGPIDAADVIAIQAILSPAINTATNNNTAATTLLGTRVGADITAVNTAAGIVGADPILATASAVANDSVGSAEAAAAAIAATGAVTAFNIATLTPATTIQTGLAALKLALAIGVTDLQAQNFIANAELAGTIVPATSTALLSIVNAAPAAVLTAVEKAGAGLAPTATTGVDLIITALQVINDAVVTNAQATLANLQGVVTATAFASAQAAAATAAFAGGVSTAQSTAVFVLNTANQSAGYVLAVNDERNIFDLRSDANNSYNLSAARLTVDFKGITNTVTVPSTNFRTTDLQMNQAIKDAINNNAVLNKLIVAADGPANSLIITSLIDGRATEANLSITLVVPAVGQLSPADVSAAAGIFGVTATETAVLAAMTAAKTAFDTKGDYVDRFAETGAVGGNVEVRGAASVTTSDNTVTPGTDNDVIVLGTTTGSEALLSSNDTVVFGAGFGNDTIVSFQAGALATGGDVLSFAALGGTTLTTAFNVNRGIVVANEVVGTNGTAALIAALFTDSATAQSYVYVAVDPATNIAKVYALVDAAGVGAGSITATLAGTIDLADTLWSTLTTENFGS